MHKERRYHPTGLHQRRDREGMDAKRGEHGLPRSGKVSVSHVVAGDALAAIKRSEAFRIEIGPTQGGLRKRRGSLRQFLAHEGRRHPVFVHFGVSDPGGAKM